MILVVVRMDEEGKGGHVAGGEDDHVGFMGGIESIRTDSGQQSWKSE